MHTMVSPASANSGTSSVMCTGPSSASMVSSPLPTMPQMSSSVKFAGGIGVVFEFDKPVIGPIVLPNTACTPDIVNDDTTGAANAVPIKIGRASCREREKIAEDAG